MTRTIGLLAILGIALATNSCGDSSNGRDESDHLRVIHRGNGADPGSLDPVLADDVHAFNVLIDLYEGLLAEDAAGKLVPGVAESWTVSADGLTYTFQLRQSARWSNGEQVVADDFVRSFRRAAAPESASVYAFLLAPIRNFAAIARGELAPAELAITALSAQQLEIRLAMPSSHWLSVLALPIAFPMHVSADRSVNNGAFQLLEREIGGAIRLQKNEMYWARETVQIDQVVYYPIANTVAEFNQYRAGELDITNSIPIEMIDSAIADFGAETRIAPALALYYLALDLTEPPFDSNELRAALSMAIDREQLVALLGRGEQAAFSIVPPGVSGYQSATLSWRDASTNRRERKAQELYAQAGYGHDSPLAIRFVYDSGDIHERVVLAVTAMWHDVLGVETTLEKREWKYFLETRDARDEWDVMRFAWSGDYNSARTFLDIFQSGNEQNLSRYSSVRYDQALSAGNREIDASTSAELMRSAERELLADHPVIPLYFFVSKHMVKPHVHGYESNAVDRHPSRYISATTDCGQMASLKHTGCTADNEP